MSAEYNFRFRIDWNVPRFDLDLTAGYIGQVKVLGYPVVGSPTQAQVDAAVAQYIVDNPGALVGVSEPVKQALLQLANKVAYIDAQGSQYYQDLYDALYPAAELVGISAAYTQSGTVYDVQSLSSLESDLVVTGLWNDGGTSTISTGYTLSGSLTAGTSTITVTYQDFTATFNVTVTQTLIHNWDFKTSVVDTVGGVTATLTNCSQSASGVAFDASTDYITLGEVFGFGKTLEIDYESATISVPSKKNGIWFWTNSGINNGFGYHYSATAENNKFGYYSSDVGHWVYAAAYGKSSFNGSGTIKLTISESGEVHVYKDGTELVFGETPYYLDESGADYITIGSSNSNYPAFYNATITGARIYNGVWSS